MDVLSPPRACDPWAVYTAKSLERNGATQELTEVQKKILKLLEETGGMEPQVIAKKLKLKMSDLERELAALRHMEKVRGKLEEGKKIILLW
jgi:predicted HTH transcriptional regulator